MADKLDKYIKAWLGREFHPSKDDNGTIYLFLEKPAQGYYGGGSYFWRVSDPSLKIQMPAGIAFHLKIVPGALHPILHPLEELKGIKS